MNDTYVTVLHPGTLKKEDLSRLPADGSPVGIRGVLNDSDMVVLCEWIREKPVRSRLETVDLGGVSGITSIPAQMFSRCSRLRTVILPPETDRLESQAFAYSPMLSRVVNTEKIKVIDSFDCFAYCEDLAETEFPETETAGSFSFRKASFRGPVTFSKLKSASSYLFQEAVFDGDVLLPEAVCCEEDAFFGASVSGKIYMPKCTELKYGIFNEIRLLESFWLTTDRRITLNPRTFADCANLKKTVLYLHAGKKNSVRGSDWGGAVWKEIRFTDDSGNVLGGVV